MKKRLISAGLVVFMTAGLLLGNRNQTEYNGEETLEKVESEALHMWYTDEALSDYLNSAALAFYEETGVKVELTLKSGLEYLEEINDASLYSEEVPDLYIISNDSLEKAYLTGLAAEISNESGMVNSTNFPRTALNAVTYQDKMVAYPFYYETSALIYNKTYLSEIAKDIIEAEQDKAEGETAQAEADAGNVEETMETQTDDAADPAEENPDADAAADETTEQISEIDKAAFEAKIKQLIPASMDEVLALADSYDPPEGMEEYLKWDVSDIFYNYFFLGNYISVGGETGDDREKVSIYNSKARSCLDVYQRLNQFFSIDAETSDYETVVNDFASGKNLFMIATTDCIATLEQAKADGSFPYEYGVAMIPMVSDGTYFVEDYIEDEEGNPIEEEQSTVKAIEELDARGLSVTSAVAVNGFSELGEQANAFANFLTVDYLDSLYDRTGKVACSYLAKHGNPAFDGFMAEYEKSIPMPKITEISNFWIQLEICFTKVWSGEDSDTELQNVANLIKMQMQ